MNVSFLWQICWATNEFPPYTSISKYFEIDFFWAFQILRLICRPNPRLIICDPKMAKWPALKCTIKYWAHKSLKITYTIYMCIPIYDIGICDIMRMICFVLWVLKLPPSSFELYELVITIKACTVTECIYSKCVKL